MLESIPSTADVRKKGRHFARRVYPMRMLGVALLALPFGSAVLELGLSAGYWILFAFNVLLWPHLAYWLAWRARDPRKIEYCNLVMDTALGGFWIAAVHLNTMPVAAMVGLFVADRVTAGGWRLLAHASLALVLAFGLTWVALDMPFHPHSSMRSTRLAILAMLVYMLALSHLNRSMAQRISVQNRELERLSRLDPGLDLPNRRFFALRAGELLAQARAQSQPISLLLLDVDLFKQVNDRFGHAVGDAVLQRIATLLVEYAGRDGFAARIGGDEFVLVLPMSEAAAGRVASALQEAVANLDMAECAGWRIGISVGVAGLQLTHANLDEWMAAADDALYMAKAVAAHHSISVGRN